MRTFVFLHVLTMFSAVAMGYGSMLLIRVAARTGDPATLRGVVAATRRLEPAIGPTFMLGIVLGLVAIFTNGFNPLAPWLLIAYALAALATVSSILVLARWIKRMSVATDGAVDMGAADAILGDRRSSALLVLDGLVVVAIIADMILKPFS